MTRLALLILVLSSPLAAQQTDWPHWRGPNHDGISLEKGWSTQGADQPLWSASLGTGYSNVSIAAGRLVSMGYDEEAGDDVVTCLDAATGDALWEYRHAAEPLANFHGGGTLSTPSITDGLVYVVNRFGKAHCLSLADGSVQWERDYQAELELKVTFHGFAASPLVQGEHLIFALGGTTFQALREDGSVVWRNADLGDGGYGNPVPFTLRGVPCLATYPGPGLRVLRASDGELLHSFDWRGSGGSVNSMTPLIVGDAVFLSCAYNKGAAFVKLTEDPEAELLWTNRRYRNKVGDSLLHAGHIYGFDEGMLKCLDLDGQEQWRVRGLGMGTLSLSDGRLIVLSSEGELIIAEATHEGYREMHRTSVLDGGVYWTPPVLVQGRLYLRNSLGDLVCRDHRAKPKLDAELVQANAVPQADQAAPAAKELLAAHVEARGGIELLQSRQSSHMTGTTELLGVGITKSDLDIFAMAPDRYLLRVHTEFGLEDRCFDGKVGWNLDPAFGDRILEGDELRELSTAHRFHLDLEGPVAYEPTLQTGSAMFEGTACWTLDGTTTEGSTRRLYFDQETGLLRGREGEQEARVEYSEWKAFDGVMVPTKVLLSRAETGVEERMVIDSVTWNEVDEGVFAQGPKVVRLLRTPKEIEAQNQAIAKAHGILFGHYKADFPPLDGAVVEVRADDGRLAMVTPRGPLHLLPPDDKGRFQAEAAPAVSVVFDAPVDGSCPGVKITIGLSTNHAPRTEAPETPEDKSPDENGD